MKSIELPAIVTITTVVAVTTLTVLSLGVLFWTQRKKQKIYSLEKTKIPTNWTKVGEVGELIMYPLKGAKRKCVSEALCTKRGLKDTMSTTRLALQDRVFVVFDESQQYLNIKKNRKMLFIETTAMDENRVKFSFPDTEDLIVRIPEQVNNSPMTKLDFWYGDKVGTVDCGDEAAEWFSQRLLSKHTGLRLGCFVESLVPARSTEGAYEKHVKVYPKFHSDYLGAYADIASYMLMGEESMKDLNSRLMKPVTEHNFRPNIMVKGSPAFSEDSWDWIRIGDNVVLRSFKYCTRCVVTSVNPDTALKDPTDEPLRALRKYRQVKEPHLKKLEGSSPVMGLYIGCHQTGTVRVGDPVFINAD